VTVHLCRSFAGSQRVFRHRHERVGGDVNSVLTELWYNLKDPGQRYLGHRLGLTKIVEACEDKGEPGIFVIGEDSDVSVTHQVISYFPQFTDE
jgi:hypothetical protein